MKCLHFIPFLNPVEVPFGRADVAKQSYIYLCFLKQQSFPGCIFGFYHSYNHMPKTNIKEVENMTVVAVVTNVKNVSQTMFVRKLTKKLCGQKIFYTIELFSQ